MKKLPPMLRFLTMQLFISGFAVSNVFAALELVIAPEKQSCEALDGNGTCWAACGYMVLHAYGFATSQTTIVNWAVNNTCLDNVVTGTCSGNDMDGTCTSVDMVLTNFGPIGTNPTYRNLLESELIYEIAPPHGGRPIIAHWRYNDGHGHDVLVTGYTGAGGTGPAADVGKVVYNDPKYGAREVMTYADFVQGSNYLWDEALRLTTDPNTPIPTPVGGDGTHWVALDYSASTVITPTSSSLSYGARSNFSPATWAWTLILTDVNGDVVVRSAITNTTSSNRSVWNIANFSLPSGHQWNYLHSGQIPGRVELVGTNGSISASVAEDVRFVPSVLYPGYVVFVNETVSSTHADVRAHSRIDLLSDVVQPAGSINFRAGSLISIKQPLTISNGSSVTFRVDPSLQ